jgi:hypothetical protein
MFVHDETGPPIWGEIEGCARSLAGPHPGIAPRRQSDCLFTAAGSAGAGRTEAVAESAVAADGGGAADDVGAFARASQAGVGTSDNTMTRTRAAGTHAHWILRRRLRWPPFRRSRCIPVVKVLRRGRSDRERGGTVRLPGSLSVSLVLPSTGRAAIRHDEISRRSALLYKSATAYVTQIYGPNVRDRSPPGPRD